MKIIIDKERPNFFMSWSGAQSQELAYTLRKLLCSVFQMPQDDVFISDSDLAGDTPWIEMVRKKASSSKIEIICITQENCKKPWIHYELGICSCLEHDFRKTIIPVYFNITSKDVPAHLDMITQNQAACVDSTTENAIGSVPYYEDLSKRIIYQVNQFVIDNDLEKFYSQYKFENNKDPKIKKRFSEEIGEAAHTMAQIFIKYNGHDSFISRPIQGVEENIAREMGELLKKIKEDCKGKKIYYAEKTEEQVSVPLSRIDIIKKSKTFLMIYPKIKDVADRLAPSSCFIELGAAMALNKEIKIFAQEGASLPAFMDEKYKRFTIERYSDVNDVYAIIIDFINNKQESYG